MIYECPQGHICFSKDSLYICGMKGCGKTTLVLSPIDIKWFYKINKTGDYVSIVCNRMADYLSNVFLAIMTF